VSINPSLLVKALQERESEEKLRIEIFEARRDEMNLGCPIQSDT
jgi:hypothetical protein